MVNKNLAANTAFCVPSDKFAVYAASSTQLSISADGEHFTAESTPFTGSKFFCDNPRTSWVKFDQDVTLSW